MIALVLALVAIICAVIAQIQARGTSLLAYAVIALAAIELLGRL